MKSKMNFKTMKKSSKDAFITYAMVVIVYLIIQAMVMSGSMSSLMQGMLVPLCTYSIVAIGLNLCVGYLGELSLGHAGFMCVGAFSSAFFTKCMEDSSMNPTVRFIIALLIGIVFAAFFGFLIGIPVLRLRGDYLAIVTLAFGEIIKNVGNIMMNHTLMFSKNKYKIGDEIELIGDNLNINYLSKQYKTIPYEITTSLNPNLKRIIE